MLKKFSPLKQLGQMEPDYFLRNVNKMTAWIPDNKLEAQPTEPVSLT
jgi:hypothetical protein